MARGKEERAFETVDQFFAEISPKPQIYVGIDPGSEGAIAFLCGNHFAVVDIPTAKIETKTRTKSGNREKRTHYDNAAICRIFEPAIAQRSRVEICVEKGSPRPTDTPLVGYSVGRAFWMWPLYFQAVGLRLIETPMPGVWKKKMGLTGADKDISRFTAQRMWPEAPLAAKAHHNRAEALLLAAFLRGLRSGKGK